MSFDFLIPSSRFYYKPRKRSDIDYDFKVGSPLSVTVALQSAALLAFKFFRFSSVYLRYMIKTESFFIRSFTSLRDTGLCT